jgi:hypothetical protein
MKDAHLADRKSVVGVKSPLHLLPLAGRCLRYRLFAPTIVAGTLTTMAHTLCRRALEALFLLSGALFIVVTMFGCSRFNESLNRGLEEEKSYTRHAMEYHREHPDQRRGDTVLEVWSKADYTAQSVEKESIAGSWARFSDQLQFLPETLKRENGKPFCVIQFPVMLLVLWPPSQPFDSCTIYLAPAPHDVAEIKSGDMAFSGRTDSWVYVLKSGK